MIELNLTATTPEEQIIKEYLENNISEALADKIHNGTIVLKDGKRLISKKDLSSFMDYANDEARNLAEKGARYACVKSDTVFGWAIHYFEEDSIVGKLYNEDGTEYKPPKPTVKKTANATTYTPPAPKPKTEFSLFDLLEGKTPEDDKNKGLTVDESLEYIQPNSNQNTITTAVSEEFLIPTATDTATLHQIDETHYADADGVVHVVEPKSSENNNILAELQNILGDTFIVRGAK